jgi:hypothetical protein
MSWAWCELQRVAVSSSEAIFLPKRAVLTRHEAANTL